MQFLYYTSNFLNFLFTCLSIANAKVQNKIMTCVRQWAWLSAIQSTVEVRHNAYFFLFPALGGVLGRPAGTPTPNG